jgi:hypothetical protein
MNASSQSSATPPQVDNDSKEARSMENAQTLGLYSPSSANGGGRFSRFDRGTSAQQNDEQYVAASAQQNDE